MRLILSLAFIFLFSLNSVLAGVVKQTKSSVRFTDFGDYITQTTMKIQGLQKVDQSDNQFKGKGLMGNLTAKFILRPGSTAELINLEEMKIYSMDHKKQEYRVKPIEKMSYERDAQQEESAEAMESQDEEVQESESNIRITRNEFKVTDSGQKKTINNFPCQEYVAQWIVEWENIETGEKGKDSLVTIVWTTQLNESLLKAQQEEVNFNKEYLSKIGLDRTDFGDEVLGTRWMELFRQLRQSPDREYDTDRPEFDSELQKIKGYAVVTDGNYFVFHEGQTRETSQEQKEEEDETVQHPRDAKGIFGGIMKKAVKKKAEPEKETVVGPKPAFSFYTELIKFETQSIRAEELAIPAGYKMVSSEP